MPTPGPAIGANSMSDADCRIPHRSAFASEAGFLATGSSDGDAIVWDLSNGDAHPIASRHVDMGERDWLTVALSPDGTRLLASNATVSTVWQVA